MDKENTGTSGGLTPKALGVEIDIGEFKPVARYHEGMGWIEFINQDVSYRAEWIDGFLEILWHPDKPEAVGIKLTMRPLKELAQNPGFRIIPGKPVPLKHLLKLLEMTYSDVHLATLYRIAREVVGDAELPAEEWEAACASVRAPS